MQKNRIRVSAFLLALVLVISMLPAVSAASLSDIKGHWAEEYINYGVTAGYISGYTDGTFLPNKTVTRAEFSKMVNTALGINHSATVSFSDIKSSDWFYNEVRKAVSAGYISGYADNTFGANRNITRQEAAVMLARIVTEPEVAGTTAFQDSATIDPWAGASVAKMAAKTYMLGDKNNNFRPKAALTRAEAAKILYEVLKNEIIASSSQSFSVVDSSYYNTIYPNNVTITEAVANGAISFNSCRILGTLTASGGLDSTVNLKNTGVNNLVASSVSGEAKVSLSGTSYVTKTVVKNGVTLSGAGFDTVEMNGTGLASDTVRLLGSFKSVTLSESTVIKATGGTISQFTVSDRVTLMLQAGTIDRFDLESAAKDSSISLADGVSIKTAYIKASADFTGNGSIQTAYESGGNVTYENRPISVVGGGSNDDEDDNNNNNNDNNYEEDEPTASLTPSFYPRNGAIGISLEPTIRLTFEDTVFRSAACAALTTDYIENTAVELREGSLTGYAVPFTATLNSNKSVITISPDEYLEPDTRYYIVFVSDTVYNEDGESNARMYSIFTTDDEENEGSYDMSSLIPTMSPADGKTNVSEKIVIRLTFKDTLFRTTGSTLSSSYVENSCLELRENSATGPLVPFSVSLNYDKDIFSITPSERLKSDTTYYVIIPRDTLSDKDGHTNPRYVARFSTGASITGSDIRFEPENGAEDVPVNPALTISFDNAVYRYGGGTVDARYLESDVITLRRGSSSGTLVTFSADISSDKRTVTILPDEELDANTTYYLRIESYALQYATNKAIPQTTSYFRVTDGTPRVSALSVGSASTSTVDLYATANVTGNITVKLSAPGQTPLSQTVAVTAGRQTSMTFTGLAPRTDYTAIATVKDAAGRTSAEKMLAFSTSTLSFDLIATDITKDSATVEAAYSTVGTLSISYKKAGDSTAKTALSGFIPNKAGTKSIPLRNLAEGTDYIVSATFVDASGNSTTRDITFTTDRTSTETALESLTVNVPDDGQYPVELLPDQDVYDLYIGYTDHITVTPVAKDSRVTITVKNFMVSNGATSSHIPVSYDEKKESVTSVSVVVRSESGATRTYILKIHVAAKEG